MVSIKKEFITFAVGAGLSAVGLTSAQLSGVLLPVGSGLISLSYGVILWGWRAGTSAAQPKLSEVPSAQPSAPSPKPTYAPSTPPTPGAPPSPPTFEKPSVATPTAPPSPSMPTTPTAPPAEPPTPAYTAPTPPSAPTVEQPKPPGRKLPSVKAPKISLPQPVIENKVPIALLAVGLVLVVVAVAITFGSAAAFFWGIFIPGILLLGFGGGLLFLRLYRRPGPVVVELRRFCMHCGFQMSSADVYCGRCHRQPPSGVDTKVCPNCGAVIPMLAKFCRDCGAGQPTTA